MQFLIDTLPDQLVRPSHISMEPQYTTIKIVLTNVPHRLIIRRMMDHVKTKKLIGWVLAFLCRNKKGGSISDQANHDGVRIIVAN